MARSQWCGHGCGEGGHIDEVEVVVGVGFLLQLFRRLRWGKSHARGVRSVCLCDAVCTDSERKFCGSRITQDVYEGAEAEDGTTHCRSLKEKVAGMSLSTFAIHC